MQTREMGYTARSLNGQRSVEMSVAQAVQQLQASCQAQDAEAVFQMFAAEATVSGEGGPIRGLMT